MLMPTMAATSLATDMVVLATDTARGLLMPMPTMVDTAMAATDMAVLATDMARGLLMPMPTMAATAMAVMAMVDSDTDMVRGPLMLTTEAMVMVVLAMAMALSAMASKAIFTNKIHQQVFKLQNPYSQTLDLNLFIGKLNCYYE